MRITGGSYFYKGLFFILVCFLIPEISRGEYIHVLFQQAASDTTQRADTVDVPEETPVVRDTIPESRRQEILDSLRNLPYRPSTRPTFRPRDRFGDPFSNFQSPSPLLLRDPPTLQMDFEMDSSNNYTVYERFGELNYRPATMMTFEEFNGYQDRQLLRNYWRNRSLGLDGESAVSGRRLIPRIYVSPVFDKIFGGSYVEINPRGFVTLDFGGRWQRIDNPSIPIRQQRNGGFEFDQQISMNVVGKIGEKLAVTANFDNNTSFDFENSLKVEYTGFEEDIIKKLEIGNVSMPINNSLITGAQNLFGIKTQMQFGKLFVTGVASTQRGKTEQVEVESGGVQARDFEVRASEYDENRHFFLGHYFRDNYEQWLTGIPQIRSGVNITRVEVYVINRQNDTESLRNVAAFMDLSEGLRIYQDQGGLVGIGGGNVPNANDANSLFFELSNAPGIRDIDQVSNILEDGSSFDMEASLHYEKMPQARKLQDSEFYFHPQLGYISLTRRLQNDEALAVAYEYTVNGRRFKVGELTEDYSNRPENEVIFLKLLRPRKINIRDTRNRLIPTWNLMMKNIYTLNASQVNREGFQFRIIYRDDVSGVDNPSLHEGANTRNIPLIELMRLDQLNPNNDPPKDGNFDFVEEVTINTDNGLIIYPVLEPFGDHLRSLFLPSEQDLIQRFVYDTLYGTTKADAELVGDKNKFWMVGQLQAGSTSEIILPGINIAEGSVQILAGGTPLIEGQDFTVDYNFGRVTIINEGVINSGKRLKITYEKADLFNFQSRTLLGTRLDYRVSDDINFGATMLHLNERPLITRVSIGDEPTRNTKYGLDINFRKESRLITKIVDAFPLLQTKEPSMVSFSGEFAQLQPGTSNIVNGEGTSYIDDFEQTVTPFNLGSNFLGWKLAATPVTDDDRFDLSSTTPDNLGNAYRRAKMSWYIVDNIFYRSGGIAKPDNITDADLDNHYVRPVIPQEIFPQQSRQIVNTNEPIFDIAYFPSERGPYNYNTNLSPEGFLLDPQSSWGGITRAITNEVDFDKTNIEFLEFWLMDPFITGTNGRVLDGVVNSNNNTGGELIFNLGSISEDVVKDGRHAFENGLPRDGSDDNVILNEWGRVTTQQYINNAFDNEEGARDNQDVGLDGLQNSREESYFSDFVNNLPASLSPAARSRILEDPSADNFQYYLDPDFDANDIKVLERYKSFNLQDGNSPVLTNNSLPYTPSGNTLPDNEDLNNDNTLNELEEYYEYRISLRPGDLEVGNKYIMDKVTNTINGDEVSWYLFRIPIRQPDDKVGNITGFKSIRFLRMYMTEFSQPVVLRMANFQLVSSQWRRYLASLEEKRFDEPSENDDTEFNISIVNIEQNSQGSENRSPYVLPPGFSRDRDNTSVNERELNEQSLQLCVENLQDEDARAVFKAVDLDLINYGRLKMFLHADSDDASDDEVTAFIRLGTDQTENYYEIEVPLKMTPRGAFSAQEIWPEENEIDLAFNELYQLKARRNRLRRESEYRLRYTETVGRYNLTVVGRPELSTVLYLFLGIRNPGTPDQADKSVCVWANELRVTDFDTRAGWAANATMNMKLADFANVTANTRVTTYGFGSLQSKISDRERRETVDYDVSANVALEKFLPESFGLKVPMYVSYQKTKITPEFDPIDPDIPLEQNLESFTDPDERDEYRSIVEDVTVRRSMNFTNVRKVKTNPEARKHIYDIENLSFTYAYSDIRSSNFNTESYVLQNYKGAVAYNYNPEPFVVEPFKGIKFLDNPFLQLIRDFNFSPMPSNLSVRADLDRRFIRTQYRNDDLTTVGIQPNYEKFFTFNRTYSLKWNLAKSLSLDYNARANAIIDEPEGDIDTDAERQIIWENLKNLGRMKNFDQQVSANYRVPFDKLPITDWFNADLRYRVGYTWQAGALSQQADFGNIIENNRERNVTGKVDMVKLYNKVGILKTINTPKRSGTPSRNQTPDTTKAAGPGKFVSGLLRLAMSVRSFNVTYTLRDGTMLPGFLPEPAYFGFDEGFDAPGFDFIFGSQDPEIRNRAANNGWLPQTSEAGDLTTPFSQNNSIDLNLKAIVEPFKDFKVQLDARKTKSNIFQEIFRYEEDSGQFVNLNPNRNGSYSISFMMFRTTFERDDGDNSSPVFRDFIAFREVIKQRLDAENPSGEYNLKSQDVLIPAFIAAYNGSDPEEVALNPFPRTPIPNWRLDYKGLGNIESLKDVFSSITITHSYNSNYTVQSFTSSLEYKDRIDLGNTVEDYPQATQQNENGDLVPVYILGQVVLSERFAPLIGLNFRTRSRLTARVEYKTERNLSLNLSNAQVTELNSKDVGLDIGYTKKNFKLPWRVQGRTQTLKNDLTFRMNFTIRDTMTLQRKIDDTDNSDINTVTSGNINLQLRPNISYVLNERLNIQFYFERSINEPRVSNSFRRSTTAFGTQIRFSLAQ